MTPAERRIAGKEAPKTATGDRICWNYNSHMGCSDSSCGRTHQFYNNYDQLSYALKIALIKRYGFKKRGKLSVAQISDQVKALRQTAHREHERNRTQPGARGDPDPMTDPARRAGSNNQEPAVFKRIDYTDQEDERRQAVRQPDVPFGTLTPQGEFPQRDRAISLTPEGGRSPTYRVQGSVGQVSQ